MNKLLKLAYLIICSGSLIGIGLKICTLTFNKKLPTIDYLDAFLLFLSVFFIVYCEIKIMKEFR